MGPSSAGGPSIEKCSLIVSKLWQGIVRLRIRVEARSIRIMLDPLRHN